MFSTREKGQVAENLGQTSDNLCIIHCIYVFNLYRYYVTYYTNAHFGYGYGPVWLRNVQCNGYENDINECTHSYGWSENSCSHSYDVGVSCSYCKYY